MPVVLPALLTDTIVFPGQRSNVPVEWEEAVQAIKAARGAKRPLVLLPETDDVALESISIGTLVDVEGSTRDDANERTVGVFGREVVSVRLISREPYLKVSAASVESWRGEDAAWVDEVEALAALAVRHVKTLWARRGHEESLEGLGARQVAWRLAAKFIFDSDTQHRLLVTDVEQQLRIVDAELRRQIRAGRSRRLRKQPRVKESAAPSERVAEAGLPEEIQRAIAEERSRGTGGRYADSSDEAVNFVLGMKWQKPEAEPIDLSAAKARLDADCYGLEVVKESVLDLLASWEWSRRQHRAGSRSLGKTLCLAGPPGVGKTAIAAVIADAMSRDLVRVPMSGVDGIFLVGADQTYLRARPGEIVRRIRQSQRHPSELVFLLDEIDKVPQAQAYPALPALLALLDPEQQAHWHDHFLDAVRIDLSDTVFICTANDVNAIAAPLLDRLQPLMLPAYSREEQVMIGKKHLLPRLRQRLSIGFEVELADDVIETLVEQSEATPGMRQLQGQLRRCSRGECAATSRPR
jgi:ATP-dependent Lon protease